MLCSYTVIGHMLCNLMFYLLYSQNNEIDDMTLKEINGRIFCFLVLTFYH